MKATREKTAKTTGEKIEDQVAASTTPASALPVEASSTATGENPSNGGIRSRQAATVEEIDDDE